MFSPCSTFLLGFYLFLLFCPVNHSVYLFRADHRLYTPEICRHYPQFPFFLQGFFQSACQPLVSAPFPVISFIWRRRKNTGWRFCAGRLRQMHRTSTSGCTADDAVNLLLWDSRRTFCSTGAADWAWGMSKRFANEYLSANGGNLTILWKIYEPFLLPFKYIKNMLQ